MEQKMSRHWPGFEVLCIVLLLGFGNGAWGSIDPGNLQKIFKYITDDGIKTSQYAVAVRLDAKTCQNPTDENLEAALPKSVLQEMHAAIQKTNGIYNPDSVGNVVAARPNLKSKDHEDAEWRLLTGSKTSLAGKILKKKEDNCLIILSKLSPCTDRCLNLNNMKKVVEWLTPLFNKLDENSRAYVFESDYWTGAKKQPKAIVNAWKKFHYAPLFRCDAQECTQCIDKKKKANPKCLA